jgi:hypothetical protein
MTHDVCGARPYPRGERDCEPRAPRERSIWRWLLGDTAAPGGNGAAFGILDAVQAPQWLLLEIYISRSVPEYGPSLRRFAEGTLDLSGPESDEDVER